MPPIPITATVEGLDDTRKTIASVRKKIGPKVMRPAVTAGVKILAKDVKQRAPKKDKRKRRTGLLKKSIGSKVKTYRSSGNVTGIVGPRLGFGQDVGTYVKGPKAGQPIHQDPVRYAHHPEQGTTLQQAQRFLKDSLADNKAIVEQTIARVAGEKIEKELAKQ